MNEQRPIAIITGASRGIGRACALALAPKCDVAIHYHTQESAAAAVGAEAQKSGARAQTFSADLTQRGAAAALVDVVAEQFGAPEILIHAAGHFLEKPLSFTSAADFDALLEVHAFSAAALAKAMLRYTRKSTQGRIVFIGSVAGQIGLGNAAAYAAAKGMLHGLGKSLALEAARWQTTVNVIAPGFVETDLTAGQADEQREQNVARVPLGRYGTAAEVAGLVAYLCLPPAAYLTGQVLTIDGGLSLG